MKQTWTLLASALRDHELGICRGGLKQACTSASVGGLQRQDMEHVWLVSALPSQDENAALLRGLAARHVPDCPDGQGRLGVRAGLELALQTCLRLAQLAGLLLHKEAISCPHGNLRRALGQSPHKRMMIIGQDNRT